MMPLAPNKTTTKPGPLFQQLSDFLRSGLEFLGASAGWIGLQDADGSLTFPVRIGAFSDSWLPWQSGHGSVWGFTVSDEPAILNDLKSRSKLGDPPLRNLLSCPLIHNKQILGHIALANKTHGFTAEDAVVLQALAHHKARLLGRQRTSAPAPIELSSSWRRILDRAVEGILLLDKAGALIYANAVWLDWTDFRAEELLGRKAPFPFWVSQQELLRALLAEPDAPANVLPFRRADQSLFWCLVETMAEQWDGHLLTMSFLRQTDKVASLLPPKLDWLPLLLDLDNGIEGWEARWEKRTGLSARDVKESRCEVVLDWLFPQQHDRDRVADCLHRPRSTSCQLVLEVAACNGGRPMLCTFLPLPAYSATTLTRRWLLLAGETGRSAGV